MINKIKYLSPEQKSKIIALSNLVLLSLLNIYKNGTIDDTKIVTFFLHGFGRSYEQIKEQIGYESKPHALCVANLRVKGDLLAEMDKLLKKYEK